MSNDNQWSSATGNVLDGTALGALLGGNGAAAGFSIDYERVPQSIADLEEAARFIREQAKVAHRLAKVAAPGIDGVSVNAVAVAQIGKWASGDGVNNLEATLSAGALQLEDLAQKPREDLKTYLQVEDLNIPKASPGLRPCELLTPQQAAGFGLDLPPRQYDAALGDLGCEWTTESKEFITNPQQACVVGKQVAAAVLMNLPPKS